MRFQDPSNFELGVSYDVCMNFSEALDAVKTGQRIARQGWNGNAMWVVLQDGYPQGIEINENTAKTTGLSAGSVQVFQPYLMMRTTQDSFVPWLASQSDLLAEDWIAERIDF